MSDILGQVKVLNTADKDKELFFSVKFNRSPSYN